MTEHRPSLLCFVCTQSLLPITSPLCVRCGIPFDESQSPEILRQCGPCVAKQPHFDLARSGFVYGEAFRDAIVRLKSTGNRRHARDLVGLVLRMSTLPDWSDSHGIVAVPYAVKTLRKRGFAPSTAVADALALVWNLPVWDDVLYRTRDTAPQRGKSAAGRRNNVRGAFRAQPGVDLSGRVVVLVDDVMTTGATLDAAAKALKVTGVTEIRCYTLGRAIIQ